MSTRNREEPFIVRLGYGCYAWLMLLAISLPMSLLLAVTPRLHRRREIARRAARLFFLAIGSPIRVAGAAADAHYPCVVVANHASYLDGIILTAALPAGFTYLVKREMGSVPIAGFILRRLGTAFVSRDDLPDRKRIARSLVDHALTGGALGFFPEGTFDEVPGLKAFQLGAFSAASRASLPVVPIVIRGSRHKLPAYRVLASPGPISVWICPPIDSREHDSSRQLMHATRRVMLEHLDEPDLAAHGHGRRGVAQMAVDARPAGEP